MKRNKIEYDRWLRMLLLSLALLTGGGWMAWGQTTFTGPVTDETSRPKIILKEHSSVITLNNGETMEMGHDSVFHEIKTIYARKNEARRLFVPELRLCVANNPNNYNERYNWFVHWYVVDRSKGIININKSGIQFSFKSEVIDEATTKMQGGDWDYIARPNSSSDREHNSDGTNGKHETEDFFIAEQHGGWVWSKRLRKQIWGKNYDEYGGGYGMDASTIYFTVTDENVFENIDIYCDVSIYQDGDWDSVTENSDIAGTYMEPTLTKRFIYRLQNPNNGNIPNKPEVFKFDYPYDETGENNTINFSMPYMPDNYFWDNYQGKCFEYKYEGEEDTEYKPFRLVSRDNKELPFQQAQRILGGSDGGKYSPTDPIIIYVRASDSDVPNLGKGNTSKPIAKFIFNPLTNSGFKLGTDITNNESYDYRWPRRYPEKYKLIGSVDFDNNDVVDQLVGFSSGSTSPANNMSQRPFGYYSQNQTSYGFLRKDAYTLLLNRKWAPQGNNLSITNNQNMYGLYRSAGKSGISYHGDICYAGHSDEDNIDWRKMYIWPAATNVVHELYDRTYMISKDKKDPNYNGQEKYGYFYYIDASNDAGTLVEVPVDNICPNTELTVTAWVADMTRANVADINGIKYNPLAPNINLIFKGINAGKEEVVLHQFTSCDALVDYGTTNVDKNGNTSNTHNNSNLMQWQQLCYSFVVDDLQGCTEFFLEVQNNEPHTDGADYAIDDIRVFMRKPEVEIIQAGDLCDTEVKTVRYASSYSNIMRVMGLTENQPVGGVNADVKWDDTLPKELKEFINNKYSGQQEEAVKFFTKIYYSVYDADDLSKPLYIDYNGNGTKTPYRVSYFSTKKEDMAWVNQSLDTGSKDITDKIYSMPLEIGANFDTTKYYVARITTQPLGVDGVSMACDACALIGDPFKLSVAGDRFTIYEGDDMETEIDAEKVEQTKTYKIVGNFRYQGSEGLETLENAKFDWFIGTLEEFNTFKVTVNDKEYTIQAALNEISTGQDTNDDIENALTEEFGVYSKDSEDGKNGKFVFGQPSFEYIMVNKYQLIVGLPRAIQGEVQIEDNLYCAEPVQILLGGTPPTIDPGDPDVPDPDDPDDPDTPEEPKDPQPDKDPEDGSPVRSVRLGLIQIQDMQANQGTLRIPVHIRKSAVDERFVVDTENSNSKIMVCETSDQERRDGLVNKEVATLDGFGDEYVATDAKPKWDKNYFKIKFEDLAVKPKEGFREGFWYMVEIPYAVKDGNGNGVVVHRGSFKLTLKIVPEYVTWVGSESGMHNWNNDDLKHWRRSTNAELYMSGDKEGAEANGTHPEAYTPMRFTKVTIYGKAKDKDGNYAIDGSAYAAYPHLYKLSKRGTDPTVLLDMAPTNMDATIGSATKNIEYDLLADPDYEQELFGEGINFENPDKKQGHSYSCVRFYGNTCDEIYIKPESEILHTEYLTYNKAHVDYETDPNRWYMLASPLKGVVSGDMYLPTGNNGIGKYARQETPAFEDIKYNTTDYTRWEPAVYMRGWNSTSVKVIYPKDEVNYGELANWSNLYNDVDVPFVSGSGFSIGTKASSKLEKESVLFRLPKADVLYHYYENDNKTSEDEKNITSKNRQGNGRFYFSPDTTSLNVTTTGMLGNPFMSHLDMKKFFDANHSTNNTYYIMSGNTTITNIAGDEYKLSTESDDPNYVAPLQSFIKNDLKNAVFTTDMIAKAPTSGKKVGLRSATAAASEKTLPQLRITASRGGVHNTALVAGLVTASDSYIEGEDAALLINEEVAAPQVYTLAGNQMTAINVTPELKDIPVGIYGKDASPVELSFKLSGDMQNVTFVDKQSGKVYPVTDGLTLTVSGNTSGRYFLNGSIATSNEVIARNEIVCYANGNGQIVVSSVDPLTRISVYSVSGQRLRYLDNLNMQTVYVKDLAPGIYIVKAESATQVYSEKMDVK